MTTKTRKKAKTCWEGRQGKSEDFFVKNIENVQGDEQGPTLKAENLSLMEVMSALAIASEDNAGGNDDELIRYAAQLLGFRRVGPDLRARLQLGLEAK